MRLQCRCCPVACDEPCPAEALLGWKISRIRDAAAAPGSDSAARAAAAGFFPATAAAIVAGRGAMVPAKRLCGGGAVHHVPEVGIHKNGGARALHDVHAAETPRLLTGKRHAGGARHSRASCLLTGVHPTPHPGLAVSAVHLVRHCTRTRWWLYVTGRRVWSQRNQVATSSVDAAASARLRRLSEVQLIPL